MALFFIASCHTSLFLNSANTVRLSPREAENIKHDRYCAHRLAWHFAHEKRSAHESYQLSKMARMALSSADSSRVCAPSFKEVFYLHLFL